MTTSIKRSARVIEKHLLENDAGKIVNIINRLHPSDSAAIFRQLSYEQVRDIIRLIEREKAARIFEELDSELQVSLVPFFTVDEIAGTVQLMRADKIADFLGRIEPVLSESLRNIMDSEEATEAFQLLKYPRESAGGIMSKDYISVDYRETLGHVLKILRGIFARINVQKANYVYVVDEKKDLVGVLQLRDLVVKDPSLAVKDVMLTSTISVDIDMDQESVAGLFRKYNLLALPVVDKNNRLAGIITADSILDVVEQEMGEDMLKISGISGGDESHNMPILRVIRKRLSWLSINIFLNIIAASVIMFYQDTLQAVIALAVFLPIISDMSGCSGMQAVVVSVRELALGKIDSSDFRRILMREMFIGFINGLVLGMQIGFVAYIWKGLWALGVVVALALWINTTISVCLGGMIPLILKRFRLDPAIASGPVLTTITDMIGFFMVLFLATRFMSFLI